MRTSHGAAGIAMSPVEDSNRFVKTDLSINSVLALIALIAILKTDWKRITADFVTASNINLINTHYKIFVLNALNRIKI